MQKLLFTYGCGRFANQLMTELNLTAWRLEHPHRFQCLSLGFSWYDFFTRRAQRLSPFMRIVRFLHAVVLLAPSHYGFRHHLERFFCHAVHRCGSWLPGWASLACHAYYDPRVKAAKTDETRLDVLTASGKNLVLCGWPIRCWDLVKKHQDALRADLVFADLYREPAEQAIAAIRAQGFETIIGIQIRQTDYKEYMAGRYFFPAAVYLRLAEQAAQTLYAGRRVALLVTSDTRQNDLTSTLPVFTGPGDPMGPYHYVSDMAALALCDLVIAVPSTFAAGAAFLGDKPYYPVQSADQVFQASDILQHSLLDAIHDPNLSLTIT